MHDRSAASAHARRPATVSIDVVLCAPRRRHLSVLLTRPRERDRWALPHAAYIPGESPKNTAAQIARRALDGQPVCLEQFGVFADGRNRSAAYLSIGFVGATCERLGGSTVRAAWFSFRDLPPMQERHVLMINAAMAALRDRMDFTPIAFGLVPTSFTLGALQSAYELLLNQRLHKAVFGARSMLPAW